MVDNTISLVIPKTQPNDRVVDALRHWLADAKAGNLRGVIILGVCADGGLLRTSRGELRNSDASHLAQLVIADAMDDARDLERAEKLPTPPDDDGEPK